jgi:hypothetical protein
MGGASDISFDVGISIDELGRGIDALKGKVDGTAVVRPGPVERSCRYSDHLPGTENYFSIFELDHQLAVDAIESLV